MRRYVQSNRAETTHVPAAPVRSTRGVTTSILAVSECASLAVRIGEVLVFMIAQFREVGLTRGGSAHVAPSAYALRYVRR